MSARLSIHVAIATTGRAYVLYETLTQMVSQTRAPDLVHICPAAPDDILAERNATLALNIRYSTGDKGASAQRNSILRHTTGADIVLFVDDDFVMADDFLAKLEDVFALHPDVVIVTGSLVADDVAGRGLTHEEASKLLDADVPPETSRLDDVFTGYGCNMAVRWSALEAAGALFDERLPLYSWGEDVDFSRQISGFGRIVKSNVLRGVHRATKHGRTKGQKFGYSQIINQAYFVRKGTIPFLPACKQALKNVAANLVRSLSPEPFVDRRGRLVGNLLGLLDLARWRIDPGRALHL